MTEQLALDGAGREISAGRPLTARQQRVLDLVRTTAGGITADEAGAEIHADLGKHHADSRCAWCAATGLSILRSKALKPLVVCRRVSSRFECRDGSTPPPVPDRSSQLSELPGETFEDMFS